MIYFVNEIASSVYLDSTRTRLHGCTHARTQASTHARTHAHSETSFSRLTSVDFLLKCVLPLDDFWQFVFSDQWSSATSLRVCEGELLTNLNETLDKLIKSEQLVRYSDVKYDTLIEPNKCFIKDGSICKKEIRYKVRPLENKSGSIISDGFQMADVLNVYFRRYQLTCGSSYSI